MAGGDETLHVRIPRFGKAVESAEVGDRSDRSSGQFGGDRGEVVTEVERLAQDPGHGDAHLDVDGVRRRTRVEGERRSRGLAPRLGECGEEPGVHGVEEGRQLAHRMVLGLDDDRGHGLGLEDGEFAIRLGREVTRLFHGMSSHWIV